MDAEHDAECKRKIQENLQTSKPIKMFFVKSNM